MSRSRRIVFLLILVPLYAACSMTWIGQSGQIGEAGRIGGRDWRTASRESVGLAPDPAAVREAVVQVYSARAIRWRGYFGVHTWIAVKPRDASEFTIHEVMGYGLQRTGTSVRSRVRAPDSRWYGNRPQLLADIRGPGVETLIPRIESAVQRYPYAATYHVWPGPNSNTFTAFVLREVPELRVDLPPTALGKDYLGMLPVARTPSGTGAQINVLGVAGIAAGWEEGVELNLLGLTFGIDPVSLAVKLPLIGSLGFRDVEPLRIDAQF